MGVSEELSSVETSFPAFSVFSFFSFQKNLVVWKHELRERDAKRKELVSEELSSVETFHKEKKKDNKK